MRLKAFYDRISSIYHQKDGHFYLMMNFLPELMYMPGTVGLTLKVRPVMSNQRLLSVLGLSPGMVLMAVVALMYSMPAAASILP